MSASPSTRGETLALVGESGSGKSLTALSILRLLPPGAAAAGRVELDGASMLDAGPARLRQARGGIAGMVFQEPMTSLNPLHRIGRQVAEALTLHGRPAVAGQHRRVCCARSGSPTPTAGWRPSRTS